MVHRGGMIPMTGRSVAACTVITWYLLSLGCSWHGTPTAADEAEAIPSMTEEEMQQPRDVIVNNDGFSAFWSGAFSTAEDLQEWVHRYQDTDVTVLEWCLGPCGGTFSFDTEVGDVLGEGVTDEEFEKLRRGDRRAAETVQRLIAEGNDPLRVVTEQAEEDGIPLFVSLRMCPFYGKTYEDFLNGSFWHENPDLRIVNQGGGLHPHMSYAYPEVRQFFLDVLSETMQYDIKGVNLDFLRHPPFFGFEPVLVEGFQAEHGVEPPGPEPEKWWRYRAQFMTRFVRELRQRLDEAEQQLGHPLRISARVDHDDYLQQGLDIETWIDEGLLDMLIVSEHGQLGGFEFSLQPFVEMLEGSDCTLLFGEEATTSGHDLTPEEDKRLARGEKLELQRGSLSKTDHCRRALRWYARGADGVHIFNGPKDFSTLYCLGTAAKARACLEEAEAQAQQ